ncbi:ABC transporter ATP-binding protein [Marispirochaeta sp.]|uniref:ABC transporter ATP-binding protein n=1 Tax=Marispirochaeta sp. TaxID=2038653 RepID=UPI0029C8D2AA|nr:ABC transporter ATP-binding protein [Marispirochaeta sp.]
MNLVLEKLRFSYIRGEPVLRDVSLSVRPGGVTGIVGPNASGKSTLLKCIAGIISPEGRILFDGKEHAPADTFWSERIGFLPQENSTYAALTVFETVLLGRLHTLAWRAGSEDIQAAMAILMKLGLENLALRSLNELSGGQRQMVFLAQTFAGDPRLLLLDEPTNWLDIPHQMGILSRVKSYVQEKQATALVVLHDLNLATRYCDELVVLDRGTIYSSGALDDVVNPRMLEDVYRVHGDVYEDCSGCRQISFIGPMENKIAEGAYL